MVMPSARLSEAAREVVRRIAAESGDSMQDVLEKAIEVYRRQRFLEESNRAFAALRADPKKWKAEQQEREEWDAAVADDLTEE